jgi:hypothetical protein
MRSASSFSRLASNSKKSATARLASLLGSSQNYGSACLIIYWRSGPSKAKPKWPFGAKCKVSAAGSPIWRPENVTEKNKQKTKSFGS